MEIVHAIVKIGQYSLVPGLSIEATRLLSSLIRYSKDSEVLRISAVEKATPLLLNLLNSPHSQLINETLVSLCLLSAPLPPIAEVVEGIDPEFLSNKILEIIDRDAAVVIDNVLSPKDLDEIQNELNGLNNLEWKKQISESISNEIIRKIGFAVKGKKNIIVDSDKSMSIRFFLLGSICQGISLVKNVLESEDVLSTIDCLKKLNVKILNLGNKNYKIQRKRLIYKKEYS